MQLLLILIAFPRYFQHRGDGMFNAWGDGIKNYYTLYSYLREPITADGIFKYNSMSYPLGDYVYYTDNTPFFALGFKWFCHHVYDATAYTIPAFNFFIIFNILLAGLVALFIFKRLLGQNIFTLLLAIVLPWINIQVLRIWDGDYNLSCSLIPLSAIALFIIWYDNLGNKPGRIATAAGMVLLIFFSFLVHGYYIAIISSFLSAAFFFAGVILFRKKYGKQNLVAAFVIPLLGAGLAMTLLYFTDKYLSLRKENAMGYDWSEIKTNFSLLFTHYDIHSVAFPVSSSKCINTESKVYLGNIGLFSFGAIWIGCLFSTPFRRRVFSIQKDYFSDPLRKSIFWAGLVCLSISMGAHYVTQRDPIKIYTPFEWVNNLGTNTILLSAGAIAILIYGTILLARPAARQRLKETWLAFKQHPFKKMGVILCFAIMVYLFVARYTVIVTNITNPLLYLHVITKRVEQFRSLSRFCWPFFWTFYIWIMYTVIRLHAQSGKKTKAIIVVSLIALGAIEVSDYVKQLRVTSHPNIYSDQGVSNFKRIKPDLKQFQAILPIPLYMVGSEDYDHTIDDNNDWSIYTMQLSLYSHLPMMACKMSRTPPQFSKSLLEMVANDSLQPYITSKLNNKPILVMVYKRLVDDSNQINVICGGRQVTKEYYKKINEFVERHHLERIDSIDGTNYYSWTPGR